MMMMLVVVVTMLRLHFLFEETEKIDGHF